jgi:hypothetical protein
MNPFTKIAVLRGSSVFFATFAIISSNFAQSSAPKNLDGALRYLVDQQARAKSPVIAPAKVDGRAFHVQRHGMFDKTGRILVNIRLDGTASLADVRAQVTRAGGNEKAVSDSYRGGVVAAYVPVAKLAELAAKKGVLSVTMSARPMTHVGLTTTGGAPVIRSDVLNNGGIKGNGITVGALSDSYDKATLDLFGNPLTIHAADDVASGDLPGPGNPNNPNPVVVVEDYIPVDANDQSATDEGRAMLQIVHDVAPKSKLAFASAFNGEVDFAQNIIKLRTKAKCDVIVDDVVYFDEPFFSDGIVAQAVDAVVNSNNLAGKKCAYFSSAGNEQGEGWVSNFTPVSDTAARAGLPGQNLKLSQVPAELTSGGFHDFNPSHKRDISQTFRIPAGTKDAPTDVFFIFQWDDPFDTPHGLTTDYNILIFDADGNFISDFSGIDDNTATQEPLEFAIFLNSGAATTFQIAITRAGNSPSRPMAQRLRYLALDLADIPEYYQNDAPATWGHSCANGAIGVAAYVYDNEPSNPPRPPFMPVVEGFTSPGPVTIVFDGNGTRFNHPQVRLKPEIAAPDGGNNTFFGDDYEGDGFPNFFGTSAAAPHAAGAAALLLQRAGGQNSLTADQIRRALEASAGPHDLNPFFIQAFAGEENVTLVTADGNGSNASSRDPNLFTIRFFGEHDDSLRSVTIDLTKAGLKFDTSIATGFPLTFGDLDGVRASDITTDAPANNASFTRLTLHFKDGAFKSGDSVSFGIDRDVFGDGGGNLPDLLQSAVVIARTHSDGENESERGAFQNTFIGRGWTIEDGFGLIDVVKAASNRH